MKETWMWHIVPFIKTLLTVIWMLYITCFKHWFFANLIHAVMYLCVCVCASGIHGPEHDRVSEARAERNRLPAGEPVWSSRGAGQPGLARLRQQGPQTGPQAAQGTNSAVSPHITILHLDIFTVSSQTERFTLSTQVLWPMMASASWQRLSRTCGGSGSTSLVVVTLGSVWRTLQLLGAKASTYRELCSR